MDSSRTCSTCDSTTDTVEGLTQIEAERTYQNYKQRPNNYGRNPYNSGIYQHQPNLHSHQQYYMQQQRRAAVPIPAVPTSPYRAHSYDNYGYGSYAYLPSYYSSPYNTMSTQPQLPVNHQYQQRPYPDMQYQTRYTAMQSQYYKYAQQQQQPQQTTAAASSSMQYLQQQQRRDQRPVVQYVEYVNSEMNTMPIYKNVQHQMCQTSSIATSLFNHQNHIVECATYEINQQVNGANTSGANSRTSSSQHMKKVGSIESNLRFLNLNSVGATANIPDGNNTGEDFDENNLNMDYNDNAKNKNNFMNANTTIIGARKINPADKRRRITIISIIVCVVVAVAILATILGTVLPKNEANKTGSVKASLIEGNSTIQKNNTILRLSQATMPATESILTTMLSTPTTTAIPSTLTEILVEATITPIIESMTSALSDTSRSSTIHDQIVTNVTDSLRLNPIVKQNSQNRFLNLLLSETSDKRS